MSKNIHKSISELVGNTPLLELVNYEKRHNLSASILGKLEYFNPTNSVKDRIAKGMIEDAEKNGSLKPGGSFVEVTSGNTGIALAALAASKGYHFKTYIQDFVSEERKQVIKAYGAELVNMSEVPEVKQKLDETGGDFMAAGFLLFDLLAQSGDLNVNQLANPANPASHYETTGEEIWRDTGGDVDVFVASVGTGGTLSGTGKYLRGKNKKIYIAAVEPVLEENDITGVHRFSDVDPSRVPPNLDKTIYDEAITVRAADAFKAAREVAKSDGILVGVSSGAALWAATQIAERPEFKGKSIAVILPDTGLRYLSTGLFAE